MRWWGGRGGGQAISRATYLEDRELVETAKRAPEAFAALFERHFQRTYRLVYSRGQNESLLQEVTARGFFFVQELFKGYRYSCSFPSLLRAVTLRSPACPV